jgi:serine/threonine-protein kinase
LQLTAAWHGLARRLRRQHRPLLSFQDALRAAGGTAGAVDRGVASIPVEAIVGSIGRWQTLRSDFLYRTGRAMTQRFYRVGDAMQSGKILPPIEVYKLKFRSGEGERGASERSEYYVLDGHHRVAMARKLGQDFLDAHVVEYVGRDAQLAHSLRQVAFLREAPADDLVALWKELREARFAAGTPICRRGEAGDGMYIVQSGSVEVRLGLGPDSMALYRLAPGDCFGEMALLTGEPRSADVVALEDTTAWILGQSAFDRVLNQSPPFLRALNRSVAHRLAMATTVIEQTRLTAFEPGPAGLRFGQYRVVAQLGAGGMAAVYSAVRDSDGLAVALKVIPSSWGAAPELYARLQSEARVLQQIQHSGVIRLLEIGPVSDRLGGGTFIAMEWLPDALDRMLRAQFPRPLDVARALHVACGVADALAIVHQADLVHRDVKPSNILLRTDGQPVLTDFGLAAALRDEMSNRRLTPPETLVGTADYLAPEVIGGRPVDGRSDMYSLGVVLYEMLAGYVPFAGRDTFQMLRAHLEEPVPKLSSAIPSEVRDIVVRSLEKDPALRFQTATELADAIRTTRAFTSQTS